MTITTQHGCGARAQPQRHKKHQRDSAAVEFALIRRSRPCCFSEPFNTEISKRWYCSSQVTLTVHIAVRI